MNRPAGRAGEPGGISDDGMKGHAAVGFAGDWDDEQRNTVQLPPLSINDAKFAEKYTLNFDRPLGSGKNGAVLEAVHNDSGIARAIKLLPDTSYSALEIRCQMMCKGNEVVEVVDVFRVEAAELGCMADLFDASEMVLVMVMELMAGGELLFQIAETGTLTESDTKQIALQMGRALKQMHALGITHRDVKPENILVRLSKEADDESARQYGLTDFGFATTEAPIGARCTLAYAAPEIIQYVLDSRSNQKKASPYTSACDCWSLGVVLFFCLSGGMPFECKEDNVLTADLTSKILKGHFSFGAEAWDSMSDDAVDVVERLLEPDVESRLTAKELLEHRWLEGLGGAEVIPKKQDKE